MDESQKLVLGEKITVRVLPGRDGAVIGRLPSGRVILFDQKSPYHDMLTPGQSVECKVIRVAPKCVIVNPMREPEPMERARRPVGETEPRERAKPQETEKDRILEDLRRLFTEGEWEKAAIAGALIHIIETLEALRKPQKSPDEPPSGPSLNDELLRAVSSFGLTQPEAGARKEPESKFLRYLDGLQEQGAKGDREASSG